MSNEETREQKMRLRIDLEDAESHLAALREKARQHGDVLIKLGTLMKSGLEHGIFVHGNSILGGIDPADLKPVTTSTFGYLDIEKMLSVADEIRTEIGKVSDLKARLAALN